MKFHCFYGAFYMAASHLLSFGIFFAVLLLLSRLTVSVLLFLLLQILMAVGYFILDARYRKRHGYDFFSLSALITAGGLLVLEYVLFLSGSKIITFSSLNETLAILAVYGAALLFGIAIFLADMIHSHLFRQK